MNIPRCACAALPTLVVLGACSSAPRYGGPREEPVAVQMREHFTLAREIRNALILSDLRAVREAAGELSGVRGVEALPPGSELALQQMRNRARSVAGAAALDQAATAGAQLFLSCAGCHTSYETGPGAVFDAQPAETPDRTLNHGLRAERLATLLWEGVLAPSDVAWRRGAAQLAEGVYIPDILAGRLERPSQIQDARDRLLRIGARAARVDTQEERARVLADVWTECSSCHELIELGGS